MELSTKRKGYTKEIVLKAIIYIFLALMAVVTLIPFYWMIVSSLKPMGDYYAVMTTFFPKNITLKNYTMLFEDTQFFTWLTNSFIVSIFSTILGAIICSLAGFVFAVYKFRFKNILFWVVLSSVAIPETVTIIPVFKIIVDLKMIDTYSSLVLPYAVSMFGIFLMRQYVSSSLPRELLAAARIDGLSEWGVFIKIAVPLIRPGLGVLAIYLWLNSWISYFWPLIMLKSNNMMTMPLGLASIYADPWNLQYGMLMAGSFLSTLPIIVIFLFAQDQFISGLTSGAVKG